MASDKKLDIRELIERGKSKGSLTNNEIMEALENVDYDIDQIDKLYDTLENMGIEVTAIRYSGFEEIESETEQYESAEDMEKMLSQEGLPIDDPVVCILRR